MRAKEYDEAHPHDFDVLIDPTGAAREAFDFHLTPLVVIIDRDGVLRFRGGVTGADDLKAVLDPLLSHSPKADPAVTPKGQP